jgi:archaellum component FlaG (FlaF/FlaG flagellin family)
MLSPSGARITDVLTFYNDGAVTTSTRQSFVVPANARIVSIHGNAGQAGSGTGNTVIDVLVNGTSIFSGATKLQLAAASTGAMTVGAFNTRSLRPGDVVTVQVTGVPSTSGHGRVAVSVSLGSI